jgi:hypothetical protein
MKNIKNSTGFMKKACVITAKRTGNEVCAMTNEEIILLARNIIRDGGDHLVEALNKMEKKECAMPVMVAYNLLRGYQAELGIPDGPEHDGKLARCKAVAEILGAYHAKLRVERPDGPQYLDAFIPLDRPDIRQRALATAANWSLSRTRQSRRS